MRNVIAEVSARLKQKRSYDCAELSRLKSSIVRARVMRNRVAAEHVRRKLEITLNRLAASLAKLKPKRGASVVAFDEAEALVSKLVTNREQAQRLIKALRQLCD